VGGRSVLGMDHFTGTEDQHPLRRVLGQVSGLLKEVEDLDPVFITAADQAEALADLDGVIDRFGLVRLAVVGAAGELAADAGCKSVADWRIAHHRRGGCAAHRDDRLAEALGGRWAATASAVREGRMSLEQAEVCVRGLDDLAAALEAEWAETRDRATDSAADEGAADDADDSGDSADTEGAASLDARLSRAWIEEVLARGEEKLISFAAEHTPAQLRRLAQHLLAVLVPDCAEELERRALERADRRAREKARLTLTATGDGTTRISGLLPAPAARSLKTYLDSLTSPRVTRPTGHGASASTIFGDPGPHPDSPKEGVGQGRAVVDPWIDPHTGRRVPAEYRRGQAFVALLERISPRHLPQHGGLGAAVVVTIDYESLRDGVGHGTIGDPGGDGVDIPVGEVRRLACASGILPAVLDSKSVPLDLGRTSRLFTMGQRKAHAITHRSCEARGCTVPAEWCESHHKRDPWAAGGSTDLADLSFLCPWHHHRAHDPGYRVTWSDSGGARFHRRR
jgi:hypothetical protein